MHSVLLWPRSPGFLLELRKTLCVHQSYTLRLLHSSLSLRCTPFAIPVLSLNKDQFGLSKGQTGCVLSSEACGADVVSQDGTFEPQIGANCPGYGKCKN